MDHLPPPPRFDGIGTTTNGSTAVLGLNPPALDLVEAALDCMAVARFQGADLDGLSIAKLCLVGWMDVGSAHLPLTGIAEYWPSPAHGRLSTDSQALRRLGQAIEPFLDQPLEAVPRSPDDVPAITRSVSLRALVTRQYPLPIALSAHDRLAARAWLESVGAA